MWYKIFDFNIFEKKSYPYQLIKYDWGLPLIDIDWKVCVGDFGCGENLMKMFIPNNKVYSFDHVAIDNTVIACDMAHTPLEDETLDVAVFSLSLWGSNFEDYFKEAYRLLNYGGFIYIAEPSKAYSEDEKQNLVKMLEKNGFGIIMHNNGKAYEDRGKFFYIAAIKR